LPEVFFTDDAARPAAAVARPTARVALFTAPDDPTFRRVPDADLLNDDFARAAMPPAFFPLPEDRAAAPRPADLLDFFDPPDLPAALWARDAPRTFAI
jgi:hypothetical protein